MYDVIIIGAGVSGCAGAYALSRYQLKVLVVEKGADVGMAASGANSGIVHGGYDPLPGTLMADLNILGNARYPALCKELEVPFYPCGSLVVARAGQEQVLEELLARGRANGVPGLTIIDRRELRQMEPHLTAEVTAALYAPEAGIVSPWELTLAFAETAAVNGVEFLFGTEVTGIRTREGAVAGVETGAGFLPAAVVINAAGLNADLLAGLAGAERYEIQPRKGEYLLLDKDLAGYVRHVVFPVPTSLSKGILVLPTVEGNILVGPTAVDTPDREDNSTTTSGLATLAREALGLFPQLPLEKVITAFTGLRGVAKGGDFVLRRSAKVPGWIDAGGISSPGLTAAPALGEKLVQLVAGLRELQPKEWAPRPPVPRLREMPLAERRGYIAENPLYGRIVCRCEGVSEGEIVDALHRPIPCTTLDGLKRRTRAGGGRCQGGFCTSRLLTVLARELGLTPTVITKAGPGSEIVAGLLAKGGGK